MAVVTDVYEILVRLLIEPHSRFPRVNTIIEG